MQGSNAALSKPVLTGTQIQALEVMRESLVAIKKRYQLLEDSVKAAEADIIHALERGASAPAGLVLRIRVTERKYPSWKSHFAEVAGAEAAERVLADTSPTVHKSLVIA